MKIIENLKTISGSISKNETHFLAEIELLPPKSFIHTDFNTEVQAFFGPKMDLNIDVVLSETVFIILFP